MNTMTIPYLKFKLDRWVNFFKYRRIQKNIRELQEERREEKMKMEEEKKQAEQKKAEQQNVVPATDTRPPSERLPRIPLNSVNGFVSSTTRTAIKEFTAKYLITCMVMMCFETDKREFVLVGFREDNKKDIFKITSFGRLGLAGECREISSYTTVDGFGNYFKKYQIKNGKYSTKNAPLLNKVWRVC